jgi:hypothetical protein
MTKQIGQSPRRHSRCSLTLEWLEDRRLLSGMRTQPAFTVLVAPTTGSLATVTLVQPTSPTTVADPVTSNGANGLTADAGTVKSIDPGLVTSPDTGANVGVVATDPASNGTDLTVITDSTGSGAIPDNSTLNLTDNLTTTPVQVSGKLNGGGITLSGGGLSGANNPPGLPVSKPGGKEPDKPLQDGFLLLAEWANHDPLKALGWRSVVELSTIGSGWDSKETPVLFPSIETGLGDKDFLIVRTSDGQCATPWVGPWTGGESEAALDLAVGVGPEAIQAIFAGLPEAPAAPSDQLVALPSERSGPLVLALDEFLSQVENLGQEVARSLEQSGWTPWVVALAATTIATEIVGRRLWRRSPRLNLASGGPDETLTWVAGLPGPFRTEES